MIPHVHSLVCGETLGGTRSPGVLRHAFCCLTKLPPTTVQLPFQASLYLFALFYSQFTLVDLSELSTSLTMAARGGGRLFAIAGLAVAGGTGYYLYQSGGDPKVAQHQAERISHTHLRIKCFLTQLRRCCTCLLNHQERSPWEREGSQD